VFQLILPFQLDLPFEAGAASLGATRAGGSARAANPRVKKPRREARTSPGVCSRSLEFAWEARGLVESDV